MMTVVWINVEVRRNSRNSNRVCEKINTTSNLGHRSGVNSKEKGCLRFFTLNFFVS